MCIRDSYKTGYLQDSLSWTTKILAEWHKTIRFDEKIGKTWRNRDKRWRMDKNVELLENLTSITEEE